MTVKRCFAGWCRSQLLNHPETAINAIWSTSMSTIFGATATFPLGPPARAGLAHHQWNSWRIAAPSRLIRLWAARHSQRRTLRELAAEKHRLDDIGLTRAHALHEAAKPFW